MPEGTLLFPGEPALEVEGPVIEAQLVETAVLNSVHFGSLIAGKAARSVDVAQGRTLVDFGLRRAHGGEAGLKAARSAFLAGFDPTSNVLAGRRYGIPVAGTMAHSFVESFPSELEAFRAFARSYPDGSILLVDTYDTVEGTRRAAEVGLELAARGHRLRGIRLDSGDLLDLSRRAREILDAAGLEDAMVFASGGLDEHDVARLLGAGAPIGGFGIGTKLVVSEDAPSLDMAYKLVELDGRPTVKLSPGKATLPASKQVWRVSDARAVRLRRDRARGRARAGSRRAAARQGDDGGTPARARAARGDPGAGRRSALPPARAHRRLDAEPYEVRIGTALAAFRDEVAARLR